MPLKLYSTTISPDSSSATTACSSRSRRAWSREILTRAVREPPIRPVRGQPHTFSAQSFLQQSIIPNLYFHCTTAYDILRHNGVELGKMDFLGTYD